MEEPATSPSSFIASELDSGERKVVEDLSGTVSYLLHSYVSRRCLWGPPSPPPSLPIFVQLRQHLLQR